MNGGKYDLQVGDRMEVAECHAQGWPRSIGTMQSISTFHLLFAKLVFFFPFRILMHMSNFNFQVHMTISKSDIQCRQTVHL